VADIPPRVRHDVLARDRRCVASILWPHVCRDAFGNVHPPTHLTKMELDHVRENPAMGETATSIPEHLVTLCHFAHQTSHWATRNRPVLRRYLDLCDGLRAPSVAAIRSLRRMVWP